MKSKTKTKVLSWLLSLALILSLVPGMSMTAVAGGVSDTLTRDDTGASGSSYVSWSDVKKTSDAVYAGQSAGGNQAIQLRVKNNNSGIVTTASGGKATKVSVVWNGSGNSGSERLDVYGKSSAYSAASDLYGDNAGTLIGSIVYGESTELTITGDYEYIGVRSYSGALYLASITFEWTAAAVTEWTSGDCIVTYDSTTTTMTVTKKDGDGNGKMADYTFDSMAPWASVIESVTTVVISDGVTGIGDCAFYDDKALNNVTFPASVTSIGTFAFYDASQQISASFVRPASESTLTVGNSAFNYYTLLSYSGDSKYTLFEGDSEIELTGAYDYKGDKLNGKSLTWKLPTYSITDKSENGTVTASVGGNNVTEAAIGDTVLLTVAPASGYQFKSITATSPNDSPEEFSDLVDLMGTAVFDGTQDNWVSFGGYTCKAVNGGFEVSYGTTKIAEAASSDVTGFSIASPTLYCFSCGDIGWNFVVNEGKITFISIYDNSSWTELFEGEGTSNGSLVSAEIELTTVTEGSNYTFTMPKKAVTVKAEFEAAASTVSFGKVTSADDIKAENIGECTFADAKAWVLTNWDDILEGVAVGVAIDFYYTNEGNLYGVSLTNGDMSKDDWDICYTSSWSTSIETIIGYVNDFGDIVYLCGFDGGAAASTVTFGKVTSVDDIKAENIGICTFDDTKAWALANWDKITNTTKPACALVYFNGTALKNVNVTKSWTQDEFKSKAKEDNVSVDMVKMLLEYQDIYLCDPAAAALEPVSYLDENETVQTCNTYTVVDANTTTWGNGWYVVSGDVEITGTGTGDAAVTVTGDAKLILCDGATLTVTNPSGYGMSVSYETALTVYAGSTGADVAGTGALSATGGAENAAGIVNSGTVSIHGGKISAFGTHDEGSFGIFNNTVITITGGVVSGKGSLFGIYPGGLSYPGMKAYGGEDEASAVGIDEYGFYSCAYARIEKPVPHVHNAGQTDEIRFAMPVGSAAELLAAKQSGTYYLTADVELDEPWRICNFYDLATGEENPVTISLCLNGHTIRQSDIFTWQSLIQIDKDNTLYIYDDDNSGQIVAKDTVFYDSHVYVDAVYCEGTFVLDGGTVSSEWIGIEAQYGGDVTMNGGTVTGCTVRTGVSINESMFTMNGGTITGNKVGITAWDAFMPQTPCAVILTGGTVTGNERGVRVACAGGGTVAAFKVSGKPTVTGNTEANVFLELGTIISVTGALDEDAALGVSLKQQDEWDSTLGEYTYVDDTGVIATGENYTLSADDAAKFTADSSDYKIEQGQNELSLVQAAHTHDFTYTADGATITATCNGTGTCDLTENKATLTIVAPERTVYNGAGSANATVSGSIPDVTTPSIVYKKGETTLDAAPTDAGTYTASITVGGKTASVTYTIAKANINPTVSLEGWAYGQAAKTPVVTGNSGNGAVTYTYAVKGSNDFSETVPTNAGDYTVKAAIAATANYNGNTAAADFTIAKADINPTVSLEGWTYGQTANTPSVSGNTEGGTVTYTYAVKNSDNFSETVPTGAGNYTVKATIAATTNYSGNTATADFTIAKANPIYTVPTDLTATYGNTLSSVTLPTGWSWADSTQNVGNAGSHTFKANFTPTDTDNYNTVENVDVTLPVNPASVTLTANSGSATYDATEKTVEGFTASVEGLTFTGVTAGVSGTNAGEYAVTFTGVTANETKDSTGNYVVTETTDGKLTIGKAPLAVTADNLSKRTGNDDPTLTYKAEGFVGTDTAETVLTGTLVRDEGDEVGTYPIKQGTLAANNNYEITFTEGTFTINRRSSGGGSSISSYTVKFDSNGGSEVKTVSVKSGQTIGSIKEPQKNGFIFTGWYSDEELSDPYSADEKVTESTTLYAGWKVDPVRQITLTIGKKEATVWNEAKSNDVAPIIRNDRTMLPARFVTENLGATVEWIGEEQKVLITKDDLKIEIYIDSDKAYVNGEEVILDSPAFIENDRTYTPVRFIAETLGVTVDWDEAAQQVIITKPVE